MPEEKLCADREARCHGWHQAEADLLLDPSVSFALKSVLRAWGARDPVDAARDARLLTEVLERRADRAVSWDR